MKKTLINKLATFGMAAAMLFPSCSKDDDMEPYLPPTPTENVAPTPNGSANTYNARVGDTLTFDSGASNDSDGDNSKQTSRWDFDGDGSFDTSFANYKTNVTHQFDSAGNYNTVLEVKDEKGKTAKKTLNKITIVGNASPTAYGTVDKTYGEIGDTFVFDTSGSTDDTTGLESRLDADGDGNYETEYSPIGEINYQYTQGGNMNPVIEVKDEDGLTATYEIGKVGVLDPANNPIDISVDGPAYAEVGETLTFNINATENENRPLDYGFNFGDGWSTSVTGNKTYGSSGVKNLEARATSDYNISNTTEDEVNIGPEKAYTKWMTDKADGKKYKFAYSDGILISVDDFQGMTSNYEGKTEEAPFYDNDSISYSMSFGKLYSRDDVNKGLKDRVFIADNTGIEWKAHVTTEAEYDQMIDAYGGYDNAGEVMKYDGFDFGGTNSSRMAMMLGGYNGSTGDFKTLGEEGRYFTGTEYSDTKNVIIKTEKNANFARKSLGNNTPRYSVKYTIEQ